MVTISYFHKKISRRVKTRKCHNVLKNDRFKPKSLHISETMKILTNFLDINHYFFLRWMVIRIRWSCVDEGGGGFIVTSSGLAEVDSF